MNTEQWRCADCSHTESGPVDELVGEEIEKTVGTGRRKKEITTVICPSCGSENWHSQAVRDVFIEP